MGKIFAVAMIFKRPINNNLQTEENLLLHIVTDCETKGDAYLKAYDQQKNVANDAGCYSKVVLEINQAPISDLVVTGFAEWTSGLYKFHGPGKWEDDDGNFYTTVDLLDKFKKEVKP